MNKINNLDDAIVFVRARYPRATALSDYNYEACWTHIYDNYNEDGLGQGNIIGTGQFEAEAWANAAKKLGDCHGKN